MSTTAPDRTPARFSLGGDEFLFVEFSEAMSLRAFFRSLLVSQALTEQRVEGLVEICPANASMQVRYDPDVIAADDLQGRIAEIDAELDPDDTTLQTRVVEMPVLYNDPWTHEVLMRFRERHQDPDSTDLEYAARINGFDGPEGFIEAHQSAPWFVSMVGFVSGLPFMYQMVERERQLEVPKYVTPRTDTPRLTVGHGGCFACMYSVRGAGGYQMFGVTPVPIFDPEQGPRHLQDDIVFFRPGDIVQFRAVDRAEHDRVVAEVDAGTYELTTAPVQFSLPDYEADPTGYAATIAEALHA